MAVDAPGRGGIAASGQVARVEQGRSRGERQPARADGLQHIAADGFEALRVDRDDDVAVHRQGAAAAAARGQHLADLLEAVEGDAGTLDEAAAPAEPQPWFEGLMESVARADGDLPEEPQE